ncbi:EpsG family protein [Porphyrobacter sp. GA68]|uniref:EpsG family protein n=1 Tax=Porphyrobacter sp. GA68 TaxID=2883480 RepID=UPI001D18341D|nr:EpsG family protein [Porphyrobacter sp. GA68]
MSPELVRPAILAPTTQSKGDEAAQQICIFIAMAAALILQSAAIAFSGAYFGLIVPFVIAFVLAWAASQSQRYFIGYATIPIVICCVILCWCIIAPLPNAEIEGLPVTDRLNYYLLYYTPGLFSYTDYEVGFLTLIALCRSFVDFPTFLVLCVTITLLGFLRVLSALKREAYFPILLCCGLGYFAFWSGVLNITRQFLAGGLVLIGISLLLAQPRSLGRAHLICALIGVVAMSIHSSAAIVFLFQFLTLVRRRDRLLATIWIFNLTLFAANFLGLDPLRPFTSRISLFQRYDIEEASAADLINIMNTGVGSGNRPDWALFLLLPMLLYYGFRILRSRSKVPQDDLSTFALFYTTLTIPFYAMSYLVYADRLAYYAYLTIPLFLLIIAASPAMKQFRAMIVAALAAVAISQFVFGWYGYTPLFWSGGLIGRF